MNTPAIHQALRLEKNPEELAWLCFPDSDLPEGINDLLRIAASSEQLNEFAKNNDLDANELSNAVYNFIEKVMLNDKNSNEKILGVKKLSTSQAQNFHYELLSKIYNPETSTRLGVEYYSSLISNSYQQLNDNDNLQDAISFSEQRKASYNHIQTPVADNTQISNGKTAMAIFSVFAICSLVAMTGKFVSLSDKQQILSSADIVNVVDEVTVDTQQVSLVNSAAIEATEESSIKATSTALQALLKSLEVAYENGNVEVIKPILANAPDLKDQTEKELNDKLETIFEITSERKMVLFDFNWTSVSGVLEGKGKFISRYQLVGEKKWLSREGIASVMAKRVNEKLKVTQLMLENSSIE